MILHFIKPIMNGRTFCSLDLKENEKDYVKYTDSLRQYYQSEEYALKQDSSYNKITWAKVLWEGVVEKIDLKDIHFIYGHSFHNLIFLVLEDIDIT